MPKIPKILFETTNFAWIPISRKNYKKFCTCLGVNYDINRLYCLNCGKFHRNRAKTFNKMQKYLKIWRKMKEKAKNQKFIKKRKS